MHNTDSHELRNLYLKYPFISIFSYMPKYYSNNTKYAAKHDK